MNENRSESIIKNKESIHSHNTQSHMFLKESCQIALLSLMEHHEYSSITITQLCKKAGVSRTGFYRNYTSKDDIIRQIIHELVFDITASLGNVFMGDSPDAYQWYLMYFRIILQKESLYQILIRANLAYRILTLTNDIVIKHMGNVDDQEKARRLVWNGAIFNITIAWISNSDRVRPEQMARWCMQYVNI